MKHASGGVAPAFGEVILSMTVAIEVVSQAADRIERLVETKGPPRLIHKEVYILHQTVAAMLVLLGIMGGVHEGYEEDD